MTTDPVDPRVYELSLHELRRVLRLLAGDDWREVYDDLLEQLEIETDFDLEERYEC